ncbi:amino acid adenylation domain-containing protein [Paenibacillus pabuli]|uniref:Amino acid adenylation domain-containing protein n=1 Tax=Paenibacillus pabuli TaxID=1472 RepID=A0ABX9BEQ3_9BACL|nr:non-ribosomal peptide synthetase [Paenibacillus pabuli]RAI89548.1 amino acid adenylation domain-containing protein [Paenibacillus pabuli]
MKSQLYKNNETISSRIVKRAKQIPNNVAVIFNNSELSYSELSEKVGEATFFLREKGVGHGDIVAVVAERSVEMLVGILAILSAGGAYLPIDPKLPKSRINFMLEDSNAKYILINRGLIQKLQLNNVIVLEDIKIREYPHNYECSVTGNDLAYVIYTSGSTGKPKGVMIEHKSVINFFNGIAKIVDFSEGKKILALTTISFDIFVLETLFSLSQGLTIILANENEQNNPKLLAELVANKVEMIQMTPSRLQLFVNHDQELKCFSRLKEIMIGGEILSKRLLDILRSNTQAKIYNMYGPTETTIWSTVSILNDDEKINIGNPINNTDLYIFDENNSLVNEEGAEGELCIGGDGLARGYLNLPNLTNEKFIPNPFNNGKRIYKTGDMVRILSGGGLEYIGRIDHQIKIRGHRVEVGEIETALLGYEPIKQVVVTSRLGKNDICNLYAYYVTDLKISTKKLKEFLSDILPEYMVPSYFIQIDTIPLTPNGKVDRQALPEPEIILSNNEGFNSKHECNQSVTLEYKIIDIVNDVLNRTISLNALDMNIEDLGIDSISFIKIITELEVAFSFEFRDEDLVMKNFPNIQALAVYVKRLIKYNNAGPAESQAYS